MSNNNRFYYFMGVGFGVALTVFNVGAYKSPDPSNLLWTIPFSVFVVGVIAKDMK